MEAKQGSGQARSKKEILAIIAKYVSRREAKNSSRNSKPLFSNIEKEQKDLAIHKREFQAELDKALKRLGDVSLFRKYLKPVRPGKSKAVVVEVKPFSFDSVRGSKPSTAASKSSPKRSLFLTSSDLSADRTTTKAHHLHEIQPSRPQTTKSAGYKSTPMHLDPKFGFPRKRQLGKSMDLSLTLESQLEGVLEKCEDLGQTCMQTRRSAREQTATETHKRHQSMEDIQDLMDGLRTEEPFNAKVHLIRRRADRQIDRDVLCSAGEVKRDYLATSEFIAKYAHKGIWRLSTLSLSRHADKLINSLPTTRGSV